MTLRRARGSICVAAACLPSGSKAHVAHGGGDLLGAARRWRRAGGLAAGELDEALGHVELPVARLDDDAHVGRRVEAQQRRQLQVLALPADVEVGGDRRRVLVDDEGDGAHAAPVGELRFDLDGHGALVERAVGGGEDDVIAGGADGAPGEHPGADLVPGRAGVRGRGGEQQGERGCGAAGKRQSRAAHEAIPSFFYALQVCLAPGRLTTGIYDERFLLKGFKKEAAYPIDLSSVTASGESGKGVSLSIE